MKILWISLLISLMGMAQASEFNVRFTDWYRMADDDKYQTGNWQGIQLDYRLDNDIYLFASHEIAQVIPLWGIGDLSMTGIGFGLNHKMSRFTFYGQVGYYLVSHENEGKHEVDPTGAGAGEGLTYYMNDKFAFIPGDYHHFDEYEIHYSNTFSGIIGFDYRHPVSKNGEITIGMSYRAMRLEEEFIVYKDSWNYEETGWRWEQNITRNYSAMGFSLGYNYQF